MKKRTNRKKRSIASKVTFRVSIILLAALAVLFVGSYFIVYNAVFEGMQKYSRAVVNVYADIVIYDLTGKGLPLAPESADVAAYYGDYICEWYDVDYAFVYVPNVDEGTITLINCSQNKRHNGEDGQTWKPGDIIEYTLTDEEYSVWTHEKVFGYLSTDNVYGHEMTTIIVTTDRNGQRAIVGVDSSYSNLYSKIAATYSILAAIILAVIAGINVIVYIVIKKNVSKPAKEISVAMQDYLKNGNASHGDFDGGNTLEYSVIAASFGRMTENINAYLDDIGVLTREKERQSTELEIAAKIQKGFLPSPRAVSEGYSIRAVMNPAKDVGGDLYDYLELDGRRVLTVIADVSGKGISAAMFMAVTLTLIRQFAKMGLSPGEILEKVNSSLSENNAALLFATAFVGIYDQNSGVYTYSNAGHNLPYVIGKKVTALDGASGTVLGLYPGETYAEASVKLDTGDTVFLYTDGVNETVNREKKFFGTERLENALSRFAAARGDDVVGFIGDETSAFASGAEQHDDTTMLALSVVRSETLYLDVDVNELTRIREKILALPLSKQRRLDLCLSAEEFFVNICSYAFPDGVPDGEKIKFTVAVSNKITLTFEDGGIPFDPLETAAAPDDYDIDSDVGGLGTFIGAASVDGAGYEYSDGKNILTLTVNFEEEKQ